MPVLIDEAYHHYVDDPNYATSMPYVTEGRPVVVARTFSKIAGMAALRIGYAVAPPEILQKMRPFSAGGVNVLAQYGAVAALKDKAAMAEVKAKTIALREKTAKDLKALGYDVIPSQANFFMVGLTPRSAAGHPGIPRRGRARRPSVPADDAAPARLGRHAGGNGSLHGRVQEDHGAPTTTASRG